MKFSMIRKRMIAASLATIMTAGILLAPMQGVFAMTSITQDEFEEFVSSYSVNPSMMNYKTYRAQFETTYPEAEIVIPASDFVRYEEDGTATQPQIYTDYEGKAGQSVVTAEDALIEYEFEVEQEGMYQVSLSYYPIEGKNSEIQRSFFLDGALPYDEMSLVEFSRVWTNDISEMQTDVNGILVKKWQVDNQGNDLKPTAIEKPEWIDSYLYDSDGYVTEELCLYLTKGKHEFSILSLREPMLLSQIKFSNSNETKSYAEVKAEWDSQGIKQTSGKTIRIEAENTVKTSSQMLYPQQDQSSPAVYPSSTKELLNNTIGGESWKHAGQWIEWNFEVEESGFYNLSMYVAQNFVRGTYVSRKILIDGEVPFEEMSDYGFEYEQSWRMDVLADENNTPYEFYLEKGEHTLRMEVVLGDFSDIISEVQDCVQQLNAIYRKVIRITGVSPDKYRDYQIEASLPGLEAELIAVRDQMSAAIDELRRVAGRSSDKEAVLITMRDQLSDLIEDQERFTKVITAYKINVRATGNWIAQVIGQPLQMDRIYFTSADSQPEVTHDSFWEKIKYELIRLFYSFIIDYNQIGNVAEGETAGNAITLWIGSGRDQANVIKSLTDETFTNQTGISVNVQLVDMNTLLRATLAGEGPDVAIQVANTNGIAGAVLNTGNDTPVNYGLRNAVLDLSQFEDFPAVRERFANSAMVPFEFNGASYALPETQTFPMMFYRKDILAELGMELPKTWDEVKVAMTVLAKNQMEFGMLPSEQIYAMLLYQMGGEYYNEDGSASALDSDIAINAFKEYAQYYTDYKLDKETSVEERFRTGECPIIIADYTTYNNLAVSAPDIKGLWDFTVVPGMEQEDGTINHATGSTGLASIIMADTANKEASWEFLKWWTSAETQTLYGREMESLMGSAARVPTANLEAFRNMAWPVEALKALEEQFEAAVGIPQVPGGYYSWRNVNNAFYTVTSADEIDTALPKEELMDKVIYINAEITYKRKEFGLPTAD